MTQRDQASVTREECEEILTQKLPKVSGERAERLARMVIWLLEELGSHEQQLQADKERLDWLADANNIDNCYSFYSDKQEHTLYVAFDDDGKPQSHQNLREAIDAARGVELAKEGT